MTVKDWMEVEWAPRRENSRVEVQLAPKCCDPAERAFESAVLFWMTKERARFEKMRGSILTEALSKLLKEPSKLTPVRPEAFSTKSLRDVTSPEI